MESATQGKPDIAMMIVARREALSMATDDDSGLWELFWDLRTRYSSIDDGALLVAAQWTVLGLVLDGLISIIRMDPETNSTREVPQEKLIHSLEDAANWSPPSDSLSAHVRFRTTDLGEAKYYSIAKLAS